MLKELIVRFRQGHRTISYPISEPTLPDRYCGRPAIEWSKCDGGCSACMEACPTNAITRCDGAIALDMGKCLFCRACEAACPNKAIAFTREHRLAAWARTDLVLRRNAAPHATAPADGRVKLFHSSFKIREVSAGGCNACEADINVLGTIGFDLGRFGIQVVASPRHADGLMITGPVPDNMKLALEKTYAALPRPAFVVVVGTCAISGEPFGDCSQNCRGAGEIVPVDMWIPGCPPHPLTILDGLLKLTGKA
ncbi:MAG: 4Fe-4S binding protein [Candidatus Brocadiia bacterium]